MRTLIEEFGHTSIALAIAAIMLTTLLIGIVLPEMQLYVMSTVTEDEAYVDKGFKKSVDRAAPTITISQPITISTGSQIDFDDYINTKVFNATNADGTDISANIVIKAADDITAKFYDESGKVFGGSKITAGDYGFTISVIDYTNEKYFGKVSEMKFSVSVAD